MWSTYWGTVEKPYQDLGSDQDYNFENDLSLLKHWLCAEAGAARGLRSGQW